MGFWNSRKNQKERKESVQSSKDANAKPEEKKENSEMDKIDQLIERGISHVMSPEYSESIKGYEWEKPEEVEKEREEFIGGKRILLSRGIYMRLLKKALRQYIVKWQSTTGVSCPETELYDTIETAVKQIFRTRRTRPNFYELLIEEAKGEFSALGKDLVTPYPYLLTKPEQDGAFYLRLKREEQDRLLKNKIKNKIEKLKAIVNKPIKYGDSGKSGEEINFDEEFNNFAEKLRDEKMDEITIFKLVTRMGELRKQYETVIRHPDKDLVERIEAQVLLEYYEQIKKQKEEREESMYAATETGSELGTGELSESVGNIEKDVSTLTWLKIIDGIFGG